MAYSAQVQMNDWTVDVQTRQAGVGFTSDIHIRHRNPQSAFEHHFCHHEVVRTERDALLRGIHEGMTWIDLKASGTIHM
jgi:hypothetical protein